MMSIESEIEQVAIDIARQLEARGARAEHELLEIKAKEAQLLRQCDAARNAQNRRLNFQIKLGSDYQCPRCWIMHETRSSLHPVHAEHPRVDILRCDACRFDLGIPF